MSLEHLHRVADELRSVFADERTAIAALDHHALVSLVERKRRLAGELATVRALTAPSPAVETLIESIRLEAHATTALASATTEAVRSLLVIAKTALTRAA